MRDFVIFGVLMCYDILIMSGLYSRRSLNKILMRLTFKKITS